MKARKRLLVAITVGCLLILALFPSLVMSYCEIPCGIYDDTMGLKMIAEHIATIEKYIKQIKELEKDKDKNYNQLVRWIMNKDNHADHLSGIAT